MTQILEVIVLVAIVGSVVIAWTCAVGLLVSVWRDR